MQKVVNISTPFSRIKCNDFGRLILTQGEQNALVIEAEQDILDALVAEVRGESLVLGLDADWFGRIGKVVSSLFNNNDYEVTYFLTVMDLDQISISGKVDLDCEAFITDALTLRVSGLGDLDFTHLDCDALDVIISGRGEFRAAGRADRQTVRISGLGEYQTADLASTSTRIVISGQANATLRVEDSLEITISGLGQVNYHGNPKLRQVISGFGRSKRLNDG